MPFLKITKIQRDYLQKRDSTIPYNCRLYYVTINEHPRANTKNEIRWFGEKNLLLTSGFELNDNDANESHVKVQRFSYSVKYLKVKEISSSESSKKRVGSKPRIPRSFLDNLISNNSLRSLSLLCTAKKIFYYFRQNALVSGSWTKID